MLHFNFNDKRLRYTLFCFLILLSVTVVICVTYYKNEMEKNEILNKLASTNAKFGYSYSATANKKLLNIIYVDQNNFKQVLAILPLIKIPYSISFSKCSLNSDDMVVLSKCDGMEIINLVDCTYSPNGSVIECLSTNSNLKEISLTARITTEYQLPLESIRRFPPIVSLGIIASVVSKKDIECISQMNLRKLDLTASNVDCESLSVISKSDTIKTLSLSQCKFYDVQCVRDISQMKNLETLILVNCDLSYANVLDCFINHPTLKTIYIDGTRLSADDMLLFEKKASGLPQLIGQPVPLGE